MKSRISFRLMLVLGGIVVCTQIGPVLRAQNANLASTNTGASTPASTSQTRPVQLSPGVPEILKLARGGVGDEVIISFIRNSGRQYPLSASEVLYLREQGVSEPVLSAMLNNQPNAGAIAAQAAPQFAPAGPEAAPATNQPAPGYGETAPLYAQPVPGYGYAVPYDYDYGYWPYYYWGYPAWGFGFVYGGGYYRGYHGGGYHGGYHGGGHPGGGFHGGGSHGGGGHR